MKGNLTVPYNFSTRVTCENVQAINDFIASHFKNVRYKINTKDGADYDIGNIEELLKYRNPSSRKITKITIQGNQDGDNFIFPNIELILADHSLHLESAILSIRRLEEKELTFYSQRIDEIIQNIKAPYFWLHRLWFNIISTLIILLSIALPFIVFLNKTYNDNLTVLILLSCFLGGFFGYIHPRIVSFFYPDTIFCIGDQIEFNSKKNKISSILFLSIIGALVIGVLSSLIVWWITK